MDMLGKSGGLSSAEELQAYLQQLQKGCTQLMVENEEVKTKAWLALRHAESESELGLGIIEAARRNAEDTHSVDMTKAAVEADHRKLADAKRIRNIYAHRLHDAQQQAKETFRQLHEAEQTASKEDAERVLLALGSQATLEHKLNAGHALSRKLQLILNRKRTERFRRERPLRPLTEDERTGVQRLLQGSPTPPSYSPPQLRRSPITRSLNGSMHSDSIPEDPAGSLSQEAESLQLAMKNILCNGCCTALNRLSSSPCPKAFFQTSAVPASVRSGANQSTRLASPPGAFHT